MKRGTMLSLGAVFLGAVVMNPGAAGAEVVRYPIPNSTFPIAQAVKVSGDTATYYISGQVPPVVSRAADPNSPQAYGGTRSQTIGAVNKIKASVEGRELGMP